MSTLGTFALASANYNVQHAAYKRLCMLQLVLTSDGSTVSVNVARSAPGFTITTGAAGALTGTAPKGARGVIMLQGLGAVADTLVGTVIAYSPTAGTFTLQTHVDNVQAVLPSDSELWALFLIEGG